MPNPAPARSSRPGEGRRVPAPVAAAIGLVLAVGLIALATGGERPVADSAASSPEAAAEPTQTDEPTDTPEPSRKDRGKDDDDDDHGKGKGKGGDD